VDVDTRVNATTVEDVVRYSPGVLIRKRFIGDPNGTLGIRTSNSFQSAHTSVYADGMPLHNPLRTSFSGAPRWSLVAPSEVESSEVLYGPFSAQYGGASFNALLGETITIESKGTLTSGHVMFIRAAARINFDTPRGTGTRRYNYNEAIQVLVP